jgi:hypothetical protein
LNTSWFAVIFRGDYPLIRFPSLSFISDSMDGVAARDRVSPVLATASLSSLFAVVLLYFWNLLPTLDVGWELEDLPDRVCVR